MYSDKLLLSAVAVVAYANAIKENDPLKLIKDESDVKIGYWKDEVSSH
jgi:hypothetical protein